MKRLLVAVLATLLLLALFGCSEKKELDIDKLSEELLSGGVFSETLEPVELDILGYIYDVSEDDYAEAAVYCSSGATADELAIFKAKDADAAKRIAEAAQQRIEEQIRGFKNYVPAEVPKLEKAYQTTYGDYVLLCVSTDPETANTIIAKYIK
ncbi:MAG TPA: DUF4358 domain-containing protein [Clostridiales bacterium]|nr:DUF4358 domain-containing protein [Clostridiales bacterium]